MSLKLTKLVFRFKIKGILAREPSQERNLQDCSIQCFYSNGRMFFSEENCDRN